MRIGSMFFILLWAFVLFPVSGVCEETGGVPISLLLRDGSIITQASPDEPLPPKNTVISASDTLVKWKNLNIAGMVYTHDHVKYTVDMNQMLKHFRSIELADPNLRPYQNGTLIIQKETGDTITVTAATLLSYMGHPDGVADILAVQFDGYNQFFREIFIDIRDVKKIRFEILKPPAHRVSSARKASSPRFAASSKEIVQALTRKDSYKSGDGSINLKILFDYNSHTIKPSSIPLLKELGKALISRELKEKSVLIKGHTDSDGSNAFNQDLSLKRARAVRTYLVAKFGISPKKLVTAGYGEETPLVPNTSKANKQKNRRVEIRLAGE